MTMNTHEDKFATLDWLFLLYHSYHGTYNMEKNGITEACL